jgi:hypothetical protein
MNDLYLLFIRNISVLLGINAFRCFGSIFLSILDSEFLNRRGRLTSIAIARLMQFMGSLNAIGLISERFISCSF